MDKKCKYDCGRDTKHEHELLFKDGNLVPDNDYRLKDEQPYAWSGEMLPVYSIWVKDVLIGKVFNGEIQINEEGKKLGYERVEYKVDPIDPIIKR